VLSTINQFSMEAPLSPLSSRPERSVVEGPAVLSAAPQSKRKRFTLYPTIAADYPALQPPAPW
jgi:hypothetical protein